MMCTPTVVEEEILRLLVRKGASINDPFAPGQRQALHFAAMSNNCALITILVQLGADLFIKNHRNETPLEVAISFKCKAAAKLLNELITLRYSDSKNKATDTSHTLLVESKSSLGSTCTLMSFD